VQTRILDYLAVYWHRADWRMKTLLFVVVAAICEARAFIGLTGTRSNSPDAFALLDPAWRVLNGQIPHADFFDSLGIVAYLPTAAGLLVAGGKVAGFGYGQALCAFALSCWAYFISRERLFDASRLLLCLVVACIAAAPFVLGDRFTHMSPGMTYNRYGYAFVALILVESLVAPGSKRDRLELVGGISTGAVVLLLLFLKITFFIGAAFLVVALAASRRQVRMRWLGLFLGFAASALLFAAYFRFDMVPMWKDLAMLAGAKHLKWENYLVWNILSSAALLLAYVFSAGWFVRAEEKEVSRGVLIAGAAVCAAGLLFIFCSFEPSGFPLQGILPILLIDLLHKQLRPDSRHHQKLRLTFLLWSGALVMTLIVPTALGLSFGVAYKIYLGQRAGTALPAILNGFVATEGRGWYQIFVEEGITLLRQHIRPGESVMSLDFSNPFSYGLRLKPARGGAICLQYRTTFDDANRPAPDFLVGQASLVMVPKHSSNPGLEESVLRLYGPYLNEHFALVSESKQWWLYRNRLAPRGTSRGTS
jgi:hypothetical protein